MGAVSDKAIGRLSLYRRVLQGLSADGVRHIYSHRLASLTGLTAAQVRRDLMAVGYCGSPRYGYEIQQLIDSIGVFLDAPSPQNAAIVGIGNLGRAIVTYLGNRCPGLAIVAAFDNDPQKAGRVIHGCRCYHPNEISRLVVQEKISIGILTVPAAEAQQLADELVASGVRGLLNFAPARLRVPPHVYVENIDMTISLEKVAYFASKDYAHESLLPERNWTT